MYSKILCNLFCVALCVCIESVAQSIPRLSPLPTAPEKEKLCLNGEWMFHSSPRKEAKEIKETADLRDWDKIQVPGEWVMQGFEVRTDEMAEYARTFFIPAEWKDRRIKLRCNAIYSESTVFVNGKLIGTHLGGFTAFEFDITNVVTPNATNQIHILVNSESIADSTSNGSFYAVHPLGGISRDIYLFSLPEINFSSFHVATRFDDSYVNATIEAEIGIANESASNIDNLKLDFSLYDTQGKKMSLSDFSFPLTEIPNKDTREINVSIPVQSPKKWDTEHPYMYTLICELKNGQNVISSSSRRIGFRQIEVRGNQVFVNNQPIKLRGVCRHEVMPLRGRSLDNDMWRKDVELFRRGNVNYIRTSHYPPDEALLDACDELGMFVEVEAPFCWAHQTDVPEELHYDVLVNQHLEMINLNRSHPSVLMWSMGNESTKFKEYFQKAAEMVKQIDPTRPRIFSQWGPEGDDEVLEIANHHYPGPEGPEKYRNHRRPITFDEFCHLNAYNRLELAADPGLRNMWGALLDGMWNDMYHSKGVLGGAIWVGIDDTFFLPGGKAVGYGTWGTIDGWRREKPEYWGMKKAYSPVKVTLKGNIDSNGKVLLHIENRHLFSNTSECTFIWEANGHQGNLYADIPPRSEGDVELTLPKEIKPNNALNLIVKGTRGFEVDRYSFRVLPETTEKNLGEHHSGKLNWKDLDEQLLVNSGQCLFTVNKRNGGLTATRQGNMILDQSPSLMILPLNEEGEGIQMTGKDQTFTPFTPVCENWVAKSIQFVPGKKVIDVTVQGSYKEAEGTFTYRFYPDEKVEMEYCFTLLQNISPRQTGLAFNIPSTFSHLEWKRKGYWSTYPEDHIGALEGEAEAFCDSLPISGLAGPSAEPSTSWAFDQTANGSNMFRSTKENIYYATLSNNLNEISVLSDGSQHFRAWKDGDNMRFLVADYNNAGSDRFLVSHAEKGYRPLRKGDIIKGTVMLSINENK